MASYSRLKFAPGHNLHTSQIRPVVRRLGSTVPRPKQSSRSLLGPKSVTAIHGQSLRYQQLHTNHAPQPVRRQNVALVRDLFSGEGKKIPLSSTAASCALKIGKEVDAHRIESLNGISLRNQALVDLKVPRLNEHLLTMRQYRGDNELVMLHLKRFLTLAETLSANRSWKDLNHLAYRAVHTDLFRAITAGDLEDHCKVLIVKMEKLAASTSIELGDMIDDYYSGIPIDLSSEFWKTVIAKAKAAALRAKAAEEDIMDTSEEFAPKPIVLNRWDADYQARHGSPKDYLFTSSTASLASFRDSLSGASTMGNQQGAGISASPISDKTAPISFKTVEELATRLVCGEHLQVCKEEMRYLRQCMRGEHSTIKADILKEMSLGVSSVISTSKQDNFDIAKFIELARPWLVAVETLHSNILAWQSIAVPESVKALLDGVKFVLDGCWAALKASMPSNLVNSLASPATAAQTSVVTMQDVSDSSVGLDTSNDPTGNMSTNNGQTSSSGVTNNASITGQTSNVFAQTTAVLDPVVTNTSVQAFSGDFESLMDCLGKLCDAHFIAEMKSEIKSLKSLVSFTDMIGENKFPLLAVSLRCVSNAGDKQWFSGPQVAEGATEWAYNMKSLKPTLNSIPWGFQQDKSRDLRNFTKKLDKVVGWLSGAPSGSTKPPFAASSGSGGSGGSSGAPTGPSGPSTGFGSGSALGGSSVAANSSSSSTVSPNVGTNVFTMFKTATQHASDNATHGRAIDTQSPADQGGRSVEEPHGAANQPPPSSNERVDAGSAPTVSRNDAILASSEDDILHSKGAYHPSLITDLLDIKSLFTHNSFSKIVASQKAHLVNLLDNKCQIKPEDVRFLRTACDYITESARQSWWSWKHLADCAGLGQFRNDMIYWQKDYLSNLADIDAYHEARLLGIEIEKVDKRMDGENEATGATRAVKPLKTRVSNA